MIDLTLGGTPSVTQLATTTDSELAECANAADTLFDAAQAMYLGACESLARVYTERIARLVQDRFPYAAYLNARYTVVLDDLAPRTRSDRLDDQHECLPQRAVLVAREVLDEQNTVIGVIDGLSPIAALVEKLTPALGPHDTILHLQHRTWFITDVTCCD